MKSRVKSTTWRTASIAVAAIGIGMGAASAAEVSPEKAGEQVGVEGQFVRVATNDEGWVVLGYRVANGSAKEEWMLLEIGMTVREGVKEQKIERDDVFLVTAEGKVVPMATQKEYQDAPLEALDARANMIHDSIDYFPSGVSRACRIGFFADPTQPGRDMAYDEVTLDPQGGCLGRVYFKVPGGIQYATYNLDVRFENSTVRVPFQIMTKEEAKQFEKDWKAAQKEQKQKTTD